MQSDWLRLIRGAKTTQCTALYQTLSLPLPRCKSLAAQDYTCVVISGGLRDSTYHTSRILHAGITLLKVHNIAGSVFGSLLGLCMRHNRSS